MKQERNERHDQLGRHGDHGKVLDRIEGRLDEHVHVDADQVGDEEPVEAEGRLDDQHDVPLAGAEAQPLVHGVEKTLDALDQALEKAHGEAEERGKDVEAEAEPHADDRIGDRLLDVATQA